MINQRVESEAIFSSDAKSESVQGKKKLKKVRSIRLLRFPSMRSSSSIGGGGGKSLYEHLYMISPVAAETSSHQLDASPNYMKGTSSSHAKESLQVTQTLITEKTLTRMYTVKLKRNVTRKLSGRTEMKRKLKSSRSIKLATVKSQNSTRKVSESESITSDVQQQSTYAVNKSQRVMTRRLSLKPVRILAKMPTFKSKNESGLHTATCSSTLKGSHFPDHIDLPQEEDGSQGVLVMKKVCRYTYCSLHGHHGHGHDDSPPLKRFVSMRRRQLKTQKSVKIDGRTVTRLTQTSNARKATQKTQTVNSGVGKSRFQNEKKEARDSCIRPHETLESTVTEGSSSEGEGEEKYDIKYDDSEVLMDETSFPDIEKDKSDSDVSETARNNLTIAACKKNEESVIAESTSIDVVKSSASDIEILEGEATTKGINTEQDNEVMQMSSAQEEPKPACATDVAYRMQERDQKYITKWHLMYKHAILSNTGKEKNKPLFDGKDQERRGQDSHSFDVENNSCQDYCEADQERDDESKNVIDLVQKAFDEILLSEPEDLSSDDGFKSRGIGSDEALLEKSEGDRVEQNTLASIESPKEESSLKGDNLRSHVDEITSQKMGTKPEQKTPKRWSNLKKLILLKRFVKALEKVRNFNLQRPRHLPSDSNLEGEKVFLKHQTAEEKRNAEEWMLDHALQKVISRLAPAQRQKVALLVEAFETILPFQDADTALQSSAKAETQANRTQSLDESLYHSKEETVEGRESRDHGYSAKILLGKALRSHNSVVEFADNASDNPMPEPHKPIMFNERCLDNPGAEMVNNTPKNGATDEDLNGKPSLTSSYDNGEKISSDNDHIHLAEIKDTRSWSSSSPAETVGSCHEEAPTNEVVNEVSDDLKSTLNAEIPNSKPESPGTDFETKNMVGADGEQFSATKSLILKGLARSLGSTFVGSEAPSDQLNEPKAGRCKSGGFDTRDQSKAPKSAVVVEPETKIEKQNNTRLWYLVYKHMVSDTAEDDPKTLIDRESEAGNEGSRARETSNQGIKDHGVADPEVELRQLEAIKMVEDAIDSILPDDQDQLPDRQSFNDNMITDNCSKESNRADRESSEGLNLKEEKTATGNGLTEEQEQEQEEVVRKEGDKSNQQLPRSWSNLRKVILLRRFIKALEKVRKFNPRGPRYLPLEPDAEAEKVNLRHQDMAERKGTEEWMLDYALRQVVSKLTPERKRKVGLLVEAFETVMPTFKN